MHFGLFIRERLRLYDNGELEHFSVERSGSKSLEDLLLYSARLLLEAPSFLCGQRACCADFYTFDA